MKCDSDAGKLCNIVKSQWRMVSIVTFCGVIIELSSKTILSLMKPDNDIKQELRRNTACRS